VVIKPGPPTAPFLHLIDNPDGAGGYDVIWAPVAHSEWYELEERKYAMVLPGGWYPLELGSSIKILRASVSVVDHRPGKYLYRVRACNASGCSGYSNEVSTEVRVLPLESPQMEEIDNPRGDDGYTIHWKQVDGANSYVLEESRTADFQSGQIIYRGRSESWTVWKKPPGDYSYRVFARDLAENCAQSGPSNTVTTRVRIVPPSWRPWEEDRKNGELWLQVKWCPVVWAVKYEIKRTDRREVWVVKKTSHEFAMKAQAQYVFQVRAVSDRNVYSDWSRPKIAIVEYDPRVGYLRVTDAKEL
jgi:hypothetical protein